jgi:hypothetical protein
MAQQSSRAGFEGLDHVRWWKGHQCNECKSEKKVPLCYVPLCYRTVFCNSLDGRHGMYNSVCKCELPDERMIY